MAGVKLKRLSSQVRYIVANFFTAGQLRDKRLKGVTITNVELSPDLSIAKVHFIQHERHKFVEKGLSSVKGKLKVAIAKQMKIRKIPELHFYYDESIEYGANIEKILADLREQSE